MAHLMRVQYIIIIKQNITLVRSATITNVRLQMYIYFVFITSNKQRWTCNLCGSEGTEGGTLASHVLEAHFPNVEGGLECVCLFSMKMQQVKFLLSLHWHIQF